jgi:hypothetical protein
MTKTIKIATISQAIDLLKKSKVEYHVLLASYQKLEEENFRMKAILSKERVKLPEGFEALFGKGLRK